MPRNSTPLSERPHYDTFLDVLRNASPDFLTYSEISDRGSFSFNTARRYVRAGLKSDILEASKRGREKVVRLAEAFRSVVAPAPAPILHTASSTSGRRFYCVPTALAAITGKPVEEVEDVLNDAMGAKRGTPVKGVYTGYTCDALERLGVRFSAFGVRKLRGMKPTSKDKAPTFAQFHDALDSDFEAARVALYRTEISSTSVRRTKEGLPVKFLRRLPTIDFRLDDVEDRKNARWILFSRDHAWTVQGDVVVDRLKRDTLDVVEPYNYYTDSQSRRRRVELAILISD